MVPPPVAVAVMLCDYVHIEEGGTRKISLIGTFTTLRVASVPARPTFFAFATLTDGAGAATIQLRVNRLATDEEIYTDDVQVQFQNKLSILKVYFRIRQCAFPAAGWYQVSFLVDGDMVAQCRLHLSL